MFWSLTLYNCSYLGMDSLNRWLPVLYIYMYLWQLCTTSTTRSAYVTYTWWHIVSIGSYCTNKHNSIGVYQVVGSWLVVLMSQLIISYNTLLYVLTNTICIFVGNHEYYWYTIAILYYVSPQLHCWLLFLPSHLLLSMLCCEASWQTNITYSYWISVNYSVSL